MHIVFSPLSYFQLQNIKTQPEWSLFSYGPPASYRHSAYTTRSYYQNTICWGLCCDCISLDFGRYGIWIWNVGFPPPDATAIYGGSTKVPRLCIPTIWRKRFWADLPRISLFGLVGSNSSWLALHWCQDSPQNRWRLQLAQRREKNSVQERCWGLRSRSLETWELKQSMW